MHFILPNQAGLGEWMFELVIHMNFVAAGGVGECKSQLAFLLTQPIADEELAGPNGYRDVRTKAVRYLQNFRLAGLLTVSIIPQEFTAESRHRFFAGHG